MWAKQSSLFSVWNWSLHSWLRSGPSRQKCRQNVLPKCAPESTMCHWSTETQTQLCCSAQISNGFIWQKRSSLGQRSMTVFVAVSLGVRCYVLGEVRAWAVNWSPPGSDLNQMAETALCAAVCAAPDLLRTSWSKNHFQLSPRSKLSPVVCRGWGHILTMFKPCSTDTGSEGGCQAAEGGHPSPGLALASSRLRG